MLRKLLVLSCTTLAIGIVTPVFAAGSGSFFPTATGGTPVTSVGTPQPTTLPGFQSSTAVVGGGARTNGIGSTAIVAPDASTLTLVFGALPAVGLIAARRRRKSA